MAMRIPTFKEEGLTDFLVRFQQDRDRLLEETLSKLKANQSLLLQSPVGKVYEVKINDAGALTITQVSG